MSLSQQKLICQQTIKSHIFLVLKIDLNLQKWIKFINFSTIRLFNNPNHNFCCKYQSKQFRYQIYYQQELMADEQQMGVLVLVLGDFHIPHRAAQVPAKYREMITPNKIHTVICTGNMGCRQIHDWAKSLSSNFYAVKGDFEDEGFKDLVDEKVVEVSGLKIGIIHGHQIIPWGDEQALANKAIEMGVTVLVSGHSHELKFSSHNGVHFINPGSMTGAFSTLCVQTVPSFIIMEIKQHQVIVYSYSLIGDELKCEDSKFDKK